MSAFCWLPILATILGLALITAGLYFIRKYRSIRVQNNDKTVDSESSLESSINETLHGRIISGLSVLVGIFLFALGLYHLISSDCSKTKYNTANINLNADANANRVSNINSTANTNESLAQLQERMDRGIKEEQYEIRRYYNNEVVKDEAGKYYSIDLKDADTKELILFNLGKYIRDEFDPAFRAAMYRVQDDIIIRLAAENVRYKLYVRGSADILGDTKPYIGRLVGGDSRKVTYLLIAPDNPNQYSQEARTETIPKEFANKHLPNLRAAYIQEKLQAMELTSTMLDGSVTGKEDERDRSALILLYWPKLSHNAPLKTKNL